ncbi:MAG: AAA family ATPase, partial [Limisphaerales bacterium]
PRKKRKRLRLGFGGTQFGYSVSFGLPKPDEMSIFSLDPEIKREAIWTGDQFHGAKLVADRNGAVLKVRGDAGWQMLRDDLDPCESMYDQMIDPMIAPEILMLRESIRRWRFYDQFRSDANALARQPMIGTRTPVLHDDGRDLPAAIQTIRECGDGLRFDQSIAQAFPGAEVEIEPQPSHHFVLRFHQHGLLRPLSATELSDGTLRYLLWAAALLTPDPPPLMVLNEPENSLHPILLAPLAALIADCATRTQIWVVTHSEALIEELAKTDQCHAIKLKKECGQTDLADLSTNVLEHTSWRWPDNV